MSWDRREAISVEEEEALLQVRDLLSNQCITHTDNGFPFSWKPRREIPFGPENVSRVVREKNAQFNMKTPMTNHDCGTIACIGGWMALILDRGPSTYVPRATGALRELFFPPLSERFDWDDIDNEMAVEAIDNFLETGDPMWSKVMRTRRH